MVPRSGTWEIQDRLAPSGHGVSPKPTSHKPEKTCRWVGAGAPGTWVCEATASGCDGESARPPGL